MRLIEQLGGYRMAKEVMDSIPKDGRSYTITRDDTGIIFNTSELHNALLEHRRQHNIFEDKDFYVYLHDWDCDLNILCKFNPTDWGDHLWNIKNMIRHATSEEIAAGHRL